MPKPVVGYNKIKAAYAGWWLLWMAAQAFLLTELGYTWPAALTDASITQLILAVAGYTINTSMSFYQPGARNSLYVLIWSLALAGLCVFLQQWALGFALSSQTTYAESIANSLIIRGLYDWLMIVLIAVLTWFWVYVMEGQESEKRKEDAAKLVREAELSNLRMQLQPHFLFNSLNSISALIVSNPEQARIMIQQLSDFLRGTVRRDERELVRLEEELQHLQLYLDIEKIRFGHRLTIAMDYDASSLGMKIPSLLLQPIVENAIKFGLYDTTGEITIALVTRVANNQLEVEITNPFDPETAQPRQGTGFGLNSIRRRLYLLYLQNNLLGTQQIGKNFVTTLKIPQAA